MQLHQILAAAAMTTTMVHAAPIGGQDPVAMIVGETSKQINDNAPKALEELNDAAERIFSKRHAHNEPHHSINDDPLPELTQATELLSGALKTKKSNNKRTPIGGQDPVGFIVDEASYQLGKENPEAGKEFDEAIGRLGLVPSEGEPHISTVAEEEEDGAAESFDVNGNDHKRYDYEGDEDYEEDEEEWEGKVDDAEAEWDEEEEEHAAPNSDPLSAITSVLGSGLRKRINGLPLPLELVSGTATKALGALKVRSSQDGGEEEKENKRQLGLPTLQGDSALSTLGGALLGKIKRATGGDGSTDSALAGLTGLLGGLGGLGGGE